MPAVQVENEGVPAESDADLLAPCHGPLAGWQPVDHSLLFLEIQTRLTQWSHCHELPTKGRNGKISSFEKRAHLPPFGFFWWGGW